MLAYQFGDSQAHMKTTAVAPSNIAFIKYWGKKDELLRLPANSNISMNLTNLLTTTTVEFDSLYQEDDITVNGERNGRESIRIIKQLDLIRKKAGFLQRAKVKTENNFPSSTGLSSSASGFAALTVAACHAANLSLNEKELSILARLGSGSACRSIPEGFVEWAEGTDSESSFASSLYPSSYWDIADVVAVVSREKKHIPTSAGHSIAGTSPFYRTRLAGMEAKIKLFKTLLEKKDFTQFGEVIEREALEMHAVMITSIPPLLYWLPTTVLLMKEVQRWRKEDSLEAYFTINTGQDVHIICQKQDKTQVCEKLASLPFVLKTIPNDPGPATIISSSHLF